jgi:alpha-galactosidase
MTIDPRFSLSITEQKGQKALAIRSAKDLAVGETATSLFAASFEELCELAAAPAAARALFADAGARTIYSNGWQSWSFAGELGPDERVLRSRIVPHLNVYTDGPCPDEGRGEVRSYFLSFVRSGEGRLFLVSRGRADAATPPVAFRVDRESLAVRAEVSARGASFTEGQLVAEIRLFYREGYFAAKDALAEAFSEYGHFKRLAFLGAKGEGSRPASLVPGGYESWYNHYTRIDEEIIARDLASIGANANLINSYYLGRGKPTVFQIDDGWEAAVGQWEPDPKKFPRGMKAFAREIEDKGMIPGIWIAPLLVTKSSAAFRDHAGWLLRDERGRPVPAGFNPGWDGVFYCLDISLPEVEDYLGALFDAIVEDWGYRYLKLDFLYAGFIESWRGGMVRRERPGAAYEHYERLMRRLTSRIEDSRGLGVAYLGCGAPLESSFRHFPLMRIGADTKGQWEDLPLKTVVRHQGRPAAYTNLTHTIGRSLLDKTVFVNDPDVVFCRTEPMKLGEAEKELIALVDLMLASQIMFSDDTHEFGGAEEAAFTSRIVGLYDRLAGGDYGAERIEKDLYSIFSRDGKLRGIVNLSDRPRAAAGFDRAKALVLHAEGAEGGKLALAPRSVSLFEA